MASLAVSSSSRNTSANQFNHGLVTSGKIENHSSGNHLLSNQHSQSVSILSNGTFDRNFCSNSRHNYLTIAQPTCTQNQQYSCKCYAPYSNTSQVNSFSKGLCCCRYKLSAVACTCKSFNQRRQEQHRQHIHYANQSHTPGVKKKNTANGCYSVYDRGNILTDEEDSAFPGLPEGEFNMLHRNIPALRRSGVDTSTIRQHFYPDGGWGWIVCGVSFLAHILTSGLQLSYGLLLFYAAQHLRYSGEIEWLGALCWSFSMLTTPFVVAFCRKKSTRLLAVVGGLVLPLGILFTSFATELGQIVFSYGIVTGIGASMVRESSTIMLGHYFKKRRRFVELVVMSGEGIGIALFSVILKEGVGKMGWRLGLQIITAITSVSFFMGLLYRPASLYHPQRRAIQHLKNQRKKVKEKKLPSAPSSAIHLVKKYFIDILPTKSTTVKVLVLTSGIASFGIYAPVFSMALHAAKEGSDIQDLVLLQTFLGMSTAFGVVIAGSSMQRSFRFRNTFVSTQILCQIFLLVVAVAILFFSFVLSYRALCVLCWIYGIGFGGFRYSFKILALERVRAKYFIKAWGLIRVVESIPVIISVPLTSFLNEYSLKYGRAGYYICSAAAAIAGILIFFIGYSSSRQNIAKTCGNGGVGVLRPTLLKHAERNEDYPPDLLHRSCLGVNQVELQCTADQAQLRYEPCLGPSSAQPMRSDTQNQRHVFDKYDEYQYNVQPPTVHKSGFHKITNTGSQSLCQKSLARHYAAAGHNFSQQGHSFGTNSASGSMGKRLQKSFSFLNNPYGHGVQCYCYDYVNCNLPYITARENTLQFCEWHGSVSPRQSSKSRSFPEGLSVISQQCNCPERCIDRFDSGHLAYLRNYQNHPSYHPAANYHRHRSQSLSKPIHFVEQITTSV